MNKILIFRTDRIGDFLVSSLLINNLKLKNKDLKVTVVCSEKNFLYVKNSRLVDNVLLLPNNFFKRLLFYLKILGKKYDVSIVLDGKKKSILTSILLKSKNKILVTNKNIYKKLLSIFFTKIFYILPNETKIFELEKVSEYLNYNFERKNTKYKNLNNLVNKKLINFINNINNYNIFHLDEKWIFNDYIKTYSNIEPSEIDLIAFLKNLSSKTNENLLITCGGSKNYLIDFIKSNSSIVEENIYKLSSYDNNLFIVDNIDIFNLEYIISHSSSIITCEGTPSHLANMYDKKMIIIIDKTEEKIFKNWTNHFTNYKLIHRTNFKDISKQILAMF